jgi:hypothetical protein
MVSEWRGPLGSHHITARVEMPLQSDYLFRRPHLKRDNQRRGLPVAEAYHASVRLVDVASVVEALASGYGVTAFNLSKYKAVPQDGFLEANSQTKSFLRSSIPNVSNPDPIVAKEPGSGIGVNSVQSNDCEIDHLL